MGNWGGVIPGVSTRAGELYVDRACANCGRLRSEHKHTRSGLRCLGPRGRNYRPEGSPRGS